MTIEAPVSKFRRNNGKLYIIACLGFAIWFGYDGYFNQKFIEKHSPEDKADATLVFNQKAPIFLIGLAVLLGVQQFVMRNKKLIADEKELVFSDRDRIAYDSIQKINKTNFESKGYFVVTYKKENDKEADRKISDRQYDNLKVILDHLVSKIT
jgi:hypothetical protein